LPARSCSTGRHQLGGFADELREPPVRADRQVRVVEAHPQPSLLGTPFFDDLRHQLEDVGLRPSDLVVAQLRPDPLVVAEVRPEDPQARTDEHDPIRAAEAGEIADVHEVADDQQVELGRLDQRCQAIGPLHPGAHAAGGSPTSSLRASSWSASR
jgi:hypothetical protein